MADKRAMGRKEEANRSPNIEAEFKKQTEVRKWERKLFFEWHHVKDGKNEYRNKKMVLIRKWVTKRGVGGGGWYTL